MRTTPLRFAIGAFIVVAIYAAVNVVSLQSMSMSLDTFALVWGVALPFAMTVGSAIAAIHSLEERAHMSIAVAALSAVWMAAGAINIWIMVEISASV